MSREQEQMRASKLERFRGKFKWLVRTNPTQPNSTLRHTREIIQFRAQIQTSRSPALDRKVRICCFRTALEEPHSLHELVLCEALCFLNGLDLECHAC